MDWNCLFSKTKHFKLTRISIISYFVQNTRLPVIKIWHTDCKESLFLCFGYDILESAFKTLIIKGFCKTSPYDFEDYWNIVDPYASVLNWTSVPNSYAQLWFWKSTLWIQVLMALVCNFSTIQKVLMAHKLISHNPNSTQGSAF